MGNLQGPEEGGRNSLSTIIFNHLVVYIGNQSPTTRARRRLPSPTTTSHHHSNRFPFPLEIFEDISASSHVDPDVRLNALTAGKKAATARSS